MLLAIILVSTSLGCITGEITGSDDLVTEKREITGFDRLDIGWGFEATVRQGSEYSITVTANENVMDRVIVSKSGNKLTIGMKIGTYDSLQLRANITMPELTRVELSGGSTGDVRGFGAIDEFDLELSGGSDYVMDGSANKLKASASGGSEMQLSNFDVQDLDIHMGDGSRGTIKVSGRIDADLSGGSRVGHVDDAQAALRIGDISIAASHNYTH